MRFSDFPPFIAPKKVATLALLACANAVFAHDGHGLQGSHWHATDTWGFVALGLGLVAVIWFARGRK